MKIGVDMDYGSRMKIGKSEDEENDDKIKQNKEEVGVSKKLKVIRNRGIK